MFFDPGTTKTKADPLSLASLIAWLEKQPARKEYCYFDNGACLIGQWALHCDPVAKVDGDGLYDYRIAGVTVDLSAFDRIASPAPHTFGDALDRARRIAAHR
jgi:hypothetical protein